MKDLTNLSVIRENKYDNIYSMTEKLLDNGKYLALSNDISLVHMKGI